MYQSYTHTLLKFIQKVTGEHTDDYDDEIEEDKDVEEDDDFLEESLLCDEEMNDSDFELEEDELSDDEEVGANEQSRNKIRFVPFI